MTMELRKFLREGMSFVLLLILGNVSSMTPLPGPENKAGLDFECTNDLERMFCQLRPRSDQPDCTEYSLNLTLNDPPTLYSKEHCIFEGKEPECSCSIRMLLIPEENYTATLWKAEEQLVSKHISTADTFKPKTPTITSVKELNGIFQIRWRTNYNKHPGVTLRAVVIYQKKGGKEEVVENVTTEPHEINGRRLDPNTSYLVRVQTYAYPFMRYSDRSEAWEFTTSTTPYNITLAVIISLSVAAIIITSVVFGCCVRLKAKWWDKVAKYPDSSLLIIVPGKEMLLNFSQTTISPICVDPPEPNDGKPWSKCSLADTSSGINTGSSLGYANTLPADTVVFAAIDDMDAIDASILKALRKALPQMSSVTDKDNGLLSADYNPCCFRADECNRSPGSSSFDNKTYAVLIPSQKQLMIGRSEIQTQPVLSCDPAYHPTEGDVLRSACPDQQVPTCLVTRQQDADMSSSVQTDFSYQLCKADSGRFSSAEDTSLCSVTSGMNTSAPCHLVSSVEAGCESLDQAISGTRNPPKETRYVYSLEPPECDANPCYGGLPAPWQSLPPADDSYQAFQSLVKQPNNLLPEQSSGELGEHLDKYPEEDFPGGLEFGIPQDPMGPVLPDFRFNGGRLPELENPFLSLLLTHNSEPVFTDNDYHSV